MAPGRPTPTDGGSLNAVAAVSATSAWAVGAGGRHAVAPGPEPGTAWRGTLNGVAAASATSAWAVGSSRGAALIEHWNGRTWNQVRGPASSILQGVAAVSAASAWAVGYNNAHGNKTLILRLTGTTWTRVPSPSPARGCIGAVL